MQDLPNLVCSCRNKHGLVGQNFRETGNHVLRGHLRWIFDVMRAAAGRVADEVQHIPLVCRKGRGRSCLTPLWPRGPCLVRRSARAHHNLLVITTHLNSSIHGACIYYCFCADPFLVSIVFEPRCVRSLTCPYIILSYNLVSFILPRLPAPEGLGAPYLSDNRQFLARNTLPTLLVYNWTRPRCA